MKFNSMWLIISDVFMIESSVCLVTCFIEMFHFCNVKRDTTKKKISTIFNASSLWLSMICFHVHNDNETLLLIVVLHWQFYVLACVNLQAVKKECYSGQSSRLSTALKRSKTNRCSMRCDWIFLEPSRMSTLLRCLSRSIVSDQRCN